jgi:hypothetical protein
MFVLLTKDLKHDLPLSLYHTGRFTIWCSLSRSCTGKNPLHRDADRNSDARIPAVEHVIAVVDIANIDVVGVVPVISPGFWPWVNQTEPIAVVLEAGISAHNQEGKAGDAEAMVLTKVSPETVVRNAVAVVAASLLPGAVV